MSPEKPAIDLAELASEVVRVMFEQGLCASAATLEVMTMRNLEYGHGTEIIAQAQALAEEALRLKPEIAEHVRWQARMRDHRPVHFSHADATHKALAQAEDEAPVWHVASA